MSYTEKRPSYPKTTEAAWYVLKDFISPLDCSERTGGSVYPMNKNWLLAEIFSGNKKYRPEYMSKRKLHQHLTQQSTLCYRSKHNGTHTEGYGISDKQAQNLSFANELNINNKIVRHDHMNIILLGIDIDGHHKEPDVLEVQNWIKNTYFEESYWEPSSNYTGRHGYLKLAYPVNTSLNHVLYIISELFTLLNRKRELSGYKAPVDIPCGLPSTISYVDKDPYLDVRNKDEYPYSSRYSLSHHSSNNSENGSNCKNNVVDNENNNSLLPDCSVYTFNFPNLLF